eukprot:TRINITY_DN1124_c0_g1_i2.p1 TRINITY_DN1124_c0_g1~~TRINITY_DN1124_c0_g1_i2.p1  ORF type:complete len:355 (+),score=73.09 TRINITY_DN1124_c0_g1_i2:256-1320(+)
MDFRVNANNNSHYDDSAEEFARYTLKGTNQRLNANYCIGLLHKDVLSLTPVRGVVQLRPSFKRIDETDRETEEHKAMEAIKIQKEKQAKTGKKAAVTVEYKRRESARAKAARLSSHEHITKAGEEEMWKEIRFDDIATNPERVAQVRAGLYPSDESLLDPNKIKFKENIIKYAQDIVPHRALTVSEIEVGIQDRKEININSLAYIRTQEFPIQVQLLLSRAYCIHFQHLLQLTQLTITEKIRQEAIKLLKEYGVMVHGRWMVRGKSWTEGVLASSWDVLLLSFQEESETVGLDWTEVSKRLQVDMNTAKLLLSKISVLGKQRRWILKKPRDVEFALSHSAVCDEQEARWSSLAM